MKAAIDKFFSEKDYTIKTESRPFHPHITIATRDLLRKIFMKHGRSLKQKKLQTECEVNGLSVLRLNSKSWDVIHTSALKK